ncbi:MAG: hypothetical protein ACLSDX_01740 [Parabacteroides merdae]|jgi:hypothetical protein
MVEAQALTYMQQTPVPAVTAPATETPDRRTVTVALHSLRTEERIPAAKRKYAEAVAMYASTDLTLGKIAKLCGVTAAGLSAHIGKHYRHLLCARYGLSSDDVDVQTVKVKKRKGQSLITWRKYKDAIAACQDIAYIEYNISQIGRMFGHDGTALASQLRFHYPDVIPFRERLRKRLGIADNTHRGVRPWCDEVYKEAVTLYRDTDMSLPEIAEKCNVSLGGLSQHLRYYHKDVVEAKAEKRAASKRKTGSRKPGRLAGNGTAYGPKPETVAKYAKALELFRTTGMTIGEIVAETGVTLSGFTGYLHQWHRGDKLRRRGYEWDGESEPVLHGTKHYLKSVAVKYAPAIESLRENPRPVAEVAAEFGHHPEVFRDYLKNHEPELYAMHGMTRRADGKLVKRSSEEKYGKAIQEYATTAEPLRSIAKRHHLVYNSIIGYVLRNCPKEREMHRRLVETGNATVALNTETTNKNR